VTNLILCGGSGTRLWPLSRDRRPKQFLPLFEGKTLFEKTVLRNRSVADRVFIVAGAAQESLVRDSMADSPYELLIEPVGRNTAPAIALACLRLEPDELVLVTPSDHLVSKAGEYLRAVGRARELAAAGALVTFGIQPQYPETGYGYIEHNDESVVSFHEKPDEAKAREYCAAGHLWNSGMFLFKAGTLLDELERWSPEVMAACRAAGGRPTKAAMEAIPSISVDYAVFEKSGNVKVVTCDPGWSDVGSFDALSEYLPNRGGNASPEGPDPVFVNSENNFVISERRKVVLIDVEDLIVVDTADALLVVKKGSGQKVKAATDILRATDPGLMN